MKPRSVALLAVIALLLGVYLLFFDRHATTTDEAAAKRQRLLPTLQVDAVRSVRIEGQGRSAVEIERLAGASSWRLKSVPGGPVDAAVLRRLLSTVEFLEWTRELPGGRNPKQLGLAPPQLAVTLGRERGPAWRLELGSADPSGTGVYARAGGGAKIVVVEASALTALDLGPQRLRDRDLMPFDATRVRRLVVQQPAASRLELARGKDGIWRLLPQGLWAQTSSADRLVGAVAGLRARRFLATTTAPSTATAILIVETRAGKTRELRVLGACPGRPAELQVALADGKSWLHACLPRDDVAPLLAARRAGLVDRALTRLSAADLSRISIARGKETLQLARRGTRWVYSRERAGAAKREQGEADGDVIRGWVSQLAARVGTVEGSPAAAARAKSLAVVAQVTLWREGGGRWSLRFGAPEAERVPVRRGKEPALLWVAPAVLEQLAVDPIRWRERTVLRLPRYEIARLAWQRRAGAGTKAAVERAERHDDGWRLVEPAGVPIDAAVLRQLLDRLAALRAERYLGSREPSIPKPAATITTLKVRLEAQRVGGPTKVRELELRLDALAAGRCRGVVEGKPPFELTASDCKALTAHLAERRLLRFRRDQLTELTLRLPGGKPLRLRKGVDGWAGDGHRPAASAISALLTTLSSLEAERVLGYGASKVPAAEALVVSSSTASTNERLEVSTSGAAVVRGRPVRYQVSRQAREALRRAVSAVVAPPGKATQ